MVLTMDNTNNQLGIINTPTNNPRSQRLIEVAANNGQLEAKQELVTITDGKHIAHITDEFIAAKGEDIGGNYLRKFISEANARFGINIRIDQEYKGKFDGFDSEYYINTRKVQYQPIDKDSSEEDNANFKKFQKAINDLIHNRGSLSDSSLMIERAQIRSMSTQEDGSLLINNKDSHQSPRLISPTKETQGSDEISISKDHSAALLSKPQNGIVNSDNSIAEKLAFYYPGALLTRYESHFDSEKKKYTVHRFLSCSGYDSMNDCSTEHAVKVTMPDLEDLRKIILPYYSCTPLSRGTVNSISDVPKLISAGELLLTRVYSDIHVEAQLIADYAGSLKSDGDAISSDVINAVSLFIAQGHSFPEQTHNVRVFDSTRNIDARVLVTNPLKFVHSFNLDSCGDLVLKGAIAYYNPIHNMVFTKMDMQKPIFAHELTHATLQNLFNNYATPYHAYDQVARASYRDSMKNSISVLMRKLEMKNTTEVDSTSAEDLLKETLNHPNSLLLRIFAVINLGKMQQDAKSTLDLYTENLHGLSKDHFHQFEAIIGKKLHCNKFGLEFAFDRTMNDIIIGKQNTDECVTYKEVYDLYESGESSINRAFEEFKAHYQLSEDDLKVISLFYRLASVYEPNQVEQEFIAMIPELHADRVADETLENYFAPVFKFWHEHVSPTIQHMTKAHQAYCEQFFFDNDKLQCKNFNIFEVLSSNSNFAHCIEEIGEHSVVNYNEL